jgi:hypothetical protein
MKKGIIYCWFILLLNLLVYPQSQEELNQQLFKAVKADNLEKVKIVVEKGSDVNARDVFKRTPLFYAVSYGFKEIETYLLSKGAVINEVEGTQSSEPGQPGRKKSALDDLLTIHSKIKEREKSIESLKGAFEKSLPVGGQETDPAVREKLEAVKRELELYYRKDYFEKEYEVNPEAGYLKGEGTLTFLDLLYECILLKNYKFFDELIDMYDKVRFDLTGNDFRLSYAPTSIQTLESLVGLRLSMVNYKNAFEIAEKAKSMVFSEMMARRGAREKIAAGDPGFKHYIDREMAIFQKINNIKTRMKKAPKAELRQLGLQIGPLFKEFDTLQSEVIRKFPLYSQLLYPVRMQPEALQELLKEDETYISYSLFEEYSMAFVITRNTFKPVKLEVGQDWVNRQIAELRMEIKKSFEAIERVCRKDRKRFAENYASYSNYPGSSNDLYMRMFNPLVPYIKTNRVLIAADDVLYGFPFEALVTKIPGAFEFNGKTFSPGNMAFKEISGEIPLFHEYSQMKYLGEKYIFSYVPSASSLNVLRGELKKEKTEVEGVIAFADPIFSGTQLKIEDNQKKGWPPERLPDTAQEAEIFKKQIGKGKIYAGLEATEENVWKANLGKAKYILFSTHGLLAKEDENVVEPSLVLTLINNPKEYDGLLGMTEAAGLRLNNDVVILSACNSAGESGKGGEGFAGMARSFLFAGSQAVVASHWQVDTRATKMLIENYGKYLKTKGRLEALEAARNVVKNAVVEYGNGKSKIKVSYAHPYFWAAFVLLGER